VIAAAVQVVCRRGCLATGAKCSCGCTGAATMRAAARTSCTCPTQMSCTSSQKSGWTGTSTAPSRHGRCTAGRREALTASYVAASVLASGPAAMAAVAAVAARAELVLMSSRHCCSMISRCRCNGSSIRSVCCGLYDRTVCTFLQLLCCRRHSQ